MESIRDLEELLGEESASQQVTSQTRRPQDTRREGYRGRGSLSPFTVFFQRTASSHRAQEQTAQLGPELTSRYDCYHS